IFEGITLHPLLISGKPRSTNRYQGELEDRFDVEMSWEKYPTSKEYSIEFDSPKNLKKAVKTLSTSKTSWTFNQDTLITGEIVYRVTSNLPKGFQVTSPYQK